MKRHTEDARPRYTRNLAWGDMLEANRCKIKEAASLSKRPSSFLEISVALLNHEHIITDRLVKLNFFNFILGKESSLLHFQAL